jgi:hypothetical protein
MILRSLKAVSILAMGVIACHGCSDSSTGPAYDPDIPTEWAAAVTNEWFPLTPGTTYEFEGDTDAGLETIVVEVLADIKVINGVTATVVRDRVYLDGELIEDTFDWYAQDAAGNVWYLGEDTKEYEGGVVVSTEGSWEWGVDDALPGIVMWADPAAYLGESYRQEYARDVAEDWGKVVALDQSVDVPYGSFAGCVETEDWNGLESGPHEHKFYCAGLGMTLEVGGGGERVELLDVTAP